MTEHSAGTGFSSSGPLHGRPEPQILSRPDGSSIAYHRLDGDPARPGQPGIVFLHGLQSDMNGSKALFLEDHCRELGRPFLRFDQLGHGQSSGQFTDGTIGRWAEDTLAVIDQLTSGPQILVGSSMGGWQMLLAARSRPQRIAGLLGIAAAPDFSEDLTWPALSPSQQQAVHRDGKVEIPADSPDGLSWVFTRAFFEDGRQNLVLRQPLDWNGPARLLQGQRDDAVPWKRALTLAAHLAGDDVRVILLKDGDHRLSRPADLRCLADTLDELYRCCGG